ncbi:AAA family ATPase [Pelosinus baikalensis]|uniref:AAA family ATPase n=1 Tax=Pelosinus baikalensis TaxID=2892015 RepID=A0ABS8HZS5_9FIRM|nr:AAA family ATPase [Pelosinus baikalensis]MCC5468676.1 AAA family ATPase [Pelosinus baikalensis]
MDPLNRFLEALDLIGKDTLDLVELEGINLKSAQQKVESIDFEELIDLYYDDPIGFSEDVLNFYPDEKQIEIMISVRDNKRTTVRSGQGVGKTATVACIIIWYMLFREGAKVIATAPTRQQLNIVLWPEIAKWLSGTYADTFLTLTKTMLYMVGYELEWFATAKTATKKENMAGLHADNMLIIVDEASGVSDEILETLLGTITGVDNRILFISNPTRNSGIFYESHHKDRDQFCCIHIDAEECERTDKENIEMLKRKYGANSNAVKVRVKGDFPDQEDDVFIQLYLVMRGVNTDYDNSQTVESIDIACDVAREGGDETVIGVKINYKVLPLEIRHGQDTMKTVGDIMQISNKLHDRYPHIIIPVKIDDTGVGGGVTDRLLEIKKLEGLEWLRIIPVKFGIPIHHKYYYDTTTLMASIVKDLLSEFDEQGNKKPSDLILPDDNELIAQLTTRKYGIYESKGKIKLESKKEMKKRGLKSPDRADCLFLLCLPVTVKDAATKRERRNRF